VIFIYNQYLPWIGDSIWYFLFIENKDNAIYNIEYFMEYSCGGMVIVFVHITMIDSYIIAVIPLRTPLSRITQISEKPEFTYNAG
jgi:hypothetical protein